MNDDAKKKLMAVWVGGVIVCVLFIGLIWAVVWSVACLAVYLFNIRWYLGVATALAGALFFFGPPAIDRSILEQQIANTRAMETTGTPIDLTGKTVVFMGRDNAWSKSDSACGYVCDSIVRHGGAKAVLFGKGQGTSLNRPEAPVDLTRYKFYTYAEPVEGRSPIVSAMVPTEITDVDYVVFSGLRPPRNIERELADGANSYGLFPGDVLTDYLVVPVSDPKAVDPYSNQIFSAYRLVRYGVTTPFVPFLMAGDLYSRHWKKLPKNHGWINDTGYRTLDFLCGPPTRNGQAECTKAMDENPHY